MDLEKLRFWHKAKEPPKLTKEELEEIARLQLDLKDRTIEDMDFRPLWEEPEEGGQILVYIGLGLIAFFQLVSLIILIFKK